MNAYVCTPGARRVPQNCFVNVRMIQPRLVAKPAFDGCASRRQQRRSIMLSATEASGETAASSDDEETLFYEGSGSNAELALSLALGATLICLPLTIASVGRRLWVSYKFTSKRVVVTTSSPVIKREVQVTYSKVKEVRSAPRAFGLWGDVVIFLKDGGRLEIAGLEDYKRIVDYIEGFIKE